MTPAPPDAPATSSPTDASSDDTTVGTSAPAASNGARARPDLRRRSRSGTLFGSKAVESRQEYLQRRAEAARDLEDLARDLALYGGFTTADVVLMFDTVSVRLRAAGARSAERWAGDVPGPETA